MTGVCLFKQTRKQKVLKSATHVAEQSRSLQDISSLKKRKKENTRPPRPGNNIICSAEQSKRGALYAMPFLFTFRATQPPEIGAMAKITLLHCVACEKATPSAGLTSLGMKIRNRHVESCVYKNSLEL
ncbi:hypothetical protein AVEN_23805-1 [Araneus ventricosus]|uniref:Uncharacterized protein n=1 Tax=Araneus ventricosus TaxID=182803 RepID=A0A4Y2LXA4_ARAVE|nr:hypothetical protein AVEN_156103-1 [Araneus ventricosus]GBN16833.1 hypothetical protein AVEN_178920-1 [Araneus ventricosus]GBN19084.1 hypothetical protein AVEN_8370-1 [Araneus ventricosus]GBN19092.1 hypothetical protein AVEN_23805-1 [Araneus ventricosus]